MSSNVTPLTRCVKSCRPIYVQIRQTDQISGQYKPVPLVISSYRCPAQQCPRKSRGLGQTSHTFIFLFVCSMAFLNLTI